MKWSTWMIVVLASSFLCAQDSPMALNGRNTVGVSVGSPLTILHTNDLHSRLNGYAPVSAYTPLSADDDSTRGGFARIATIFEEERKQAAGHVLTLDAGDFLMGTFFTALESSTGFQLGLMKEMGYDAIAIGNHEFDFGPAHLSRLINRSLQAGDIPPLLLANIAFDPEKTEDDSLELLVRQQVIKPYQIVEIDSLKVGLLSLMGENAISVAPAMTPAKGLDPVKTCRKYVKQLRRKEGVDFVILLSHTGMVRDENGVWTGDDVALAEKVEGIDLIISGHSHTRLSDPVIINGVPIVQTKSYGEYVGKIELVLDVEGLSLESYQLIPVDDRVAGNALIDSMIRQQEDLIEEQFLAGLGLSYEGDVLETDFPLLLDEDTLLAESNLGRFISTALHTRLNQIDTVRTDITVYPAGMVRDNITPGIQTTADLYRVASLGNGDDGIPGYAQARVYVSAKELKGIMEILYASSFESPGNFCFFGGLDVRYDPEGGLLKKVTGASLLNPDGSKSEMDFSKRNPRLYSLAADAYLLEFLSMFKKLSRGLVKVVPKYADGSPVTDFERCRIDADPVTTEIEEVKAWTCLIEYTRSFADTNGNGVPDVPGEFMLR